MKASSTTTSRKNLHHPPVTAIPAISPEVKKILDDIGASHPMALNTKHASAFFHAIGIPIAASTLEVFRSQGRGPKYKKIGSRVFYTVAFLEEYAQGVEIKIYDPSEN
ncbi:hypothetical protein JWJ90_17015 [Desulfobulbus rhabdoformis]|uniref:hypothetical protein n=1 Tax=Desulfobulbus rhabdoformis TaxID=34032 RepID=UPI00196278E0|nr:hypothetical protein [Desulfobulbus rhabdoformis]MBM9615972.1 hypothetical protein [Desulfobulbus rhabdoformis]